MESLIWVLMTGTFNERSSYIDLLFTLPTMYGQMPVVDGTHKNAQIWYQD